MNPVRIAAMALLAAASLPATPAQAQSVSLSVGGQLAPGVYGRVDIGNTPPPVVYAQPVIIAPPPHTVVAPAPVYMHVPPGQARKWAKYCRRYNACGVPVYFVRTPEYGPERGMRERDREEHGHCHGHGREHGGGHDRD